MELNRNIDTGGKLTQASSHDLRLPSHPIEDRKLKQPMTPNFAHLRVGTKNERWRRFLQSVFPLGRGGGAVVANKAVVSEALVGAAITPSAVPMGRGGPANTSCSRMMVTMSLPMMAGTTPEAVL